MFTIAYSDFSILYIPDLMVDQIGSVKVLLNIDSSFTIAY